MEVVTEKYGQPLIGSDTDYSKFYRLPKEHFQINVKNDYDYINGVKESIRFFSLDLPAEIKEIYIPFSEAPIFWIYESSLLTQLEEFMKFNLVKGSYAELHKSIKDNYSRWVTTKLKSEKEYYATLTVNFIERDINKANIFNLIIKAIIHAYQGNFYNPVKALDIISDALELLKTVRLNDFTKTELKYILYLYEGFVHLKENLQEKARTAFKNAIDVKPSGSTAKIYCALTELNLENGDAVKYLLREVLNYDVHRLTMAIKTNNAGMFSYFYRNAFVYNIFHEKDFVKAYDIILTVLSEMRISEANGLESSKEKLEALKTRNMEDYYDEEIVKSIQFFEKLIQNYAGSKNTLLVALQMEFQLKFEAIIDAIMMNVRADYEYEIKEKLTEYDVSINDNATAEKQLLNELEKFKAKSKENLAESLRNIQENFEIETKAIERHIDDLPNLDRFNPRVSLSNNMTYNIIIAFIVFFIGGVTGYSNKTVADASEFNSIFTFILIAGSKWGAISFILGTVISMILSGVILLERSDMKYRLLRKINYLKIEKDRLIADLKSNYTQKEKMMCDTMNSSINNHRKYVEELVAKKAEAEKVIRIEAEQKINSILLELQEI